MTESALDPRTVRYLAALDRVPLPQDAYRTGDPQKPGLYEALLQRFVSGRLGATDVLIDFGCGSTGRTTRALLESCGASVPPRYVAVDVKAMLDALPIPTEMHENSAKLVSERFIAGDFADVTGSASFLIIQNVLHELDIATTAGLFHHLRNHLPTDAQIYFQDMATLPEAEKRNVPWNPALLEEMLRAIGFEARIVSDQSKSGTLWFHGNARRTATGKIALPDVVKACVSARRKQLEHILKSIDDATRPGVTTDTLGITRLTLDHAQLTLQLNMYSDLGKLTASTPVVNRFDYIVDFDSAVKEVSGLTRVFAQKDLIDFAALYASSHRMIWMAGYSQRSMFTKPRNVDLLIEAARRGVQTRLLMSDPASIATELRGLHPAYGSVELLRGEIEESLQRVAAFQERLRREIGGDIQAVFDVRLSTRGFPASYFLVDDECYVSLYSARVTGSSGPCLVFSRIEGVARNYYLLLYDEFNDAFQEALPFTFK